MILKKLINQSVYGTIGYISSLDSLNILEQYILYNLEILKEYKQIIVATNYSSPLQLENKKLWKKYFPNVVLIDCKTNRGHNHGYADLDNAIFDYCKANNIKWLCKSANDTILNTEILNKEVKNADFYYLSGIGVGGMAKHNFDFQELIEVIKENYYPQTNFYFINVSKVDYLNNKQYLDETYQSIQNISNYNGKIWEYIRGWACEEFLRACVKRNNLSKYHLIPEDKYIKLLQIIKDYNIHDSSHKNIMIEGICHYHYFNKSVIKI